MLINDPGTPPLERRLGFKQHLRAAVVAGDATYLHSEAGVRALRGDELAALAPLLDGTRSLAEIIAALPGLPAVRVGQLIGQLISSGLVRSSTTLAPTGESRADEAYWDLAGLDGSAAALQVAQARVEVVPVGMVDASRVHTALVEAGVGVVAHDPLHTEQHAMAMRIDPDCALVVVVCDDYLRAPLALVDRLLAARGVPWLCARAGGAATWIGPVFGAGTDGPCWECLAHRLRANRVRETALHPLGDGRSAPLPPAARTGLTATLDATLIALAASQWLAGLRRPDQAEIRVHDSITAEVTSHQVHRRPQCAVCGSPDLVALRTAEPVRIPPTPKDRSDATGHRAHPAERTFDTYRHLIGTVSGVVPELRREQGLPAGMHSYLAGRNPALGTSGHAALSRSLRLLCGGKGPTDADARTSALCEALERHSGQLHGDELRVRGRLADLPDAVDPARVMLFDERQAGEPGVPLPLDPQAEIDWTPVWSMTTQRHVLLPTALLYFDQRTGADAAAGRRFVVADSNGNAAGSSLADAVLQGVLELVERDAVALWWYNRTRQAGVDLDSFGDPWLTTQVALHASLGRELTVLDLTTDLGVPAVVAVSRRASAGVAAEDVCFGFGAHLDAAVAVRRAVAEVAQLMPGVLPPAGAAHGHRSTDPALRSWWDTATTATHPWLAADPHRTAMRRDDWTCLTHDDLADDVSAVCALLAERGLELLVLDQTRPDIGLPVVKVIVPGLRHFWRRLAPGRLFDVPVASGRVPAPTGYDDVNPVELFL